MTAFRLSDGMDRLEAIVSTFDDTKTMRYAQLVREFLRGVRDRECYDAFFEVTRGLGIELPYEARERLAGFIAGKRDYGWTTRNVCQWFLLEQHAMDLGMIPDGRSIYEPLIQLLELGGDFYECHGDLYIRDLGVIDVNRKR